MCSAVDRDSWRNRQTRPLCLISRDMGGRVVGSLSCHESQEVSETVRVRFRVWFQAVKILIFGGFPVESPTNKATTSSSSKGKAVVRVRFGGVPSTVEEVVRVQFCCLLRWKNNMGNTGRTVLGHCPGVPLLTQCREGEWLCSGTRVPTIELPLTLDIAHVPVMSAPLPWKRSNHSPLLDRHIHCEGPGLGWSTSKPYLSAVKMGR